MTLISRRFASCFHFSRASAPPQSFAKKATHVEEVDLLEELLLVVLELTDHDSGTRDGIWLGGEFRGREEATRACYAKLEMIGPPGAR